jgi:hypothetical protein
VLRGYSPVRWRASLELLTQEWSSVRPVPHRHFSSRSSPAQQLASAAALDPSQRNFTQHSSAHLYKTLLLIYYDVSFRSALSPIPSIANGGITFREKFGYTPVLGRDSLRRPATSNAEGSAGRERLSRKWGVCEAENCPVHACQTTFIAARSDDTKFAFTANGSKKSAMSMPRSSM